MKILFIFIIFISFDTWASTIVIADKNLNLSESIARIKSLNSTPYSDFILEKLRTRSDKKALIQKATELRTHELNNDHEKIFLLCSDVFKKRHDADWGPSDRFFINRCLTHLSKLHSDPRSQVSMKQEALAFSNESLETSKIPPSIYRYYSWILINGKAFPTNKKRVELPNTNFRMTLLSNRYLAISKVIDAQKLINFQYKKQALVNGNCQSGFRYESRHLDHVDIQNTTVVARDCKLPLLITHPIEKAFASKKSKDFKMPTWAWWLAGGVLGYAIYENSQNHSGGSTPTTKRGF